MDVIGHLASCSQHSSHHTTILGQTAKSTDLLKIMLDSGPLQVLVTGGRAALEL